MVEIDLNDLLDDAYENIKKTEKKPIAATKDSKDYDFEKFMSSMKGLEKDNYEDGENDGNVDGLIDQILSEFTSSDFLSEPFAELALEYPKWIGLNKEELDGTLLANYQRQCDIVIEISKALSRNDSGEEAKKHVMEKLEEMQDLGPLPKDLMQKFGQEDSVMSEEMEKMTSTCNQM